MLQTFSVHGEWVMSFHSKGRSLQGDFKPPAVRFQGLYIVAAPISPRTLVTLGWPDTPSRRTELIPREECLGEGHKKRGRMR